MATGNKTKAHARELGKNMTDAEQALWAEIRKKQLLGFAFRRQRPLGPYIVDFVCFKARLVIEIDGGQHVQNEGYDRRRTHWLEDGGFRVIRFWNHEVLTEMDAVLQRIRETLATDPEED